MKFSGKFFGCESTDQAKATGGSARVGSEELTDARGTYWLRVAADISHALA